MLAPNTFSEDSDAITFIALFYGSLFGFVIIVIQICCIILCIKKYRENYNRASNNQQFELRSGRTIQTITRSNALTQQLPLSHRQQPSPPYMQQLPASFPKQQSIPYPQCLYLPPTCNNTGYPDKEVDLEVKTSGIPPPPPSYDDLFKY